MTVLFKRLTLFRFLTVPPSAVHGLPKYDGIPPSTGTDVQHGKITSGIFPRTTLEKTPRGKLIPVPGIKLNELFSTSICTGRIYEFYLELSPHS